MGFSFVSPTYADIRINRLKFTSNSAVHDVNEPPLRRSTDGVMFIVAPTSTTSTSSAACPPRSQGPPDAAEAGPAGAREDLEAAAGAIHSGCKRESGGRLHCSRSEEHTSELQSRQY